MTEEAEPPDRDLWERWEDRYYAEGCGPMVFRLALLIAVNATVIVIGLLSFAAGAATLGGLGVIWKVVAGVTPYKLTSCFALIFLLWIMTSPEDSGWGEWTLMILAQLASAMIPVTLIFHGYPAAGIAAWVTCLILSGMLATGMWLLHSWRTNRWARQMHALKAENEARRAAWETPPLDR